MPSALLRLNDRVVTDSGEVALGYGTLVAMARDGRDFHSELALGCDRVAQYNRIARRKLRAWKDDGEVAGPAEGCYLWTTPEPWASMDVWQACMDRMVGLGLDGQEHMDRFGREMREMVDRDMVPVLRQVAYMVDDWTRRGVVWGVGRGSSCASLILFLLGLNLVDPVRHRIPLEEFLR